MRIALPAINPTIGDLAGNAELIAAATAQHDADLFVFPELAICGYPPRDLLLTQGFVESCEQACDQLAASLETEVTVLIGSPVQAGSGTANALIAYRSGTRLATYHKRLLPTYDVFDERRYFTPGSDPVVLDLNGTKVGLSICEDAWRGHDAGVADRYADSPDPIEQLAAAGAELIVSASASPFVLRAPAVQGPTPNAATKAESHLEILRDHAKRFGVPIASVNQLGGNDELIFDGQAALVGASGDIVAQRTPFASGPSVFTLDHTPAAPEPTDTNVLLFEALKLGVRDYLRKTGFRTAVLGLSGGIDSAATAAVAVAALGPDAVTGVAMPGKYSSDHSTRDAYDLAVRLGIACPTAPIAGPFDAYVDTLNSLFTELNQPAVGAQRPDLTEENLQSRVRGALMMALSNRTGAILLTTGNKSELAVGYCTLYGDMNGGLAVLSDVPKTDVYNLCRALNDRPELFGFDRPPIPESTIEKPPSAELAPDQKDSDSLPDYEILDAIVQGHVEDKLSPAAICERYVIDRATVDRIVRLIDRNEYKRKQMPTGLKVTHVAFGVGRRMPIACRSFNG